MMDWQKEQLKVATGVTNGSINSEYERGFIDGMQEQMRRSVDRAVNAMTRQAIATEESSATQEPVAMPDFDIFSEDGENWYEHPADAQLIYDALGDGAKVGDTFDVWAGWSSVRVAYQIISVSEDGECEVKQINPQPNEEQDNHDDLTIAYMSGYQDGKKAQPKREWVGLTDEEKEDCLFNKSGLVMDYEDVVNSVEAKLKEKNA